MFLFLLDASAQFGSVWKKLMGKLAIHPSHLFCKRIMLPTYLAWSSLRISYLLYILRKGQALQFNWLYEQGAFILNPDDTFSVDFDKVSLPQFQILGYTYNISIVITIIISYYYL